MRKVKPEPVTAGKEGRILITNLHNYAMPFIRYDIDDLGVGSDAACPCGRGLPLLAAINGRTWDTILTRSKGRIPGMRLYQPFRSLAHLGVEQCQIVQETYGKVLIKLVLPGKEYKQEQMDKVNEKVTAEYKRILGEDMDILIELVDQIPRTPLGKRKIVISNFPQKNGEDPAI